MSLMQLKIEASHEETTHRRPTVSGSGNGGGGSGARRRSLRQPSGTLCTRGRLDGVVGVGRAEQVATDTLESPTVAAVDGRRRVEVQAVGGDGVRRRLGIGRARGEVRASQRVLNAGRERGVEVEVVVRVLASGGEDLVHAAEDGGHPRGGRRRRGPQLGQDEVGERRVAALLNALEEAGNVVPDEHHGVATVRVGGGA